jgi:hypothetical protein
MPDNEYEAERAHNIARNNQRMQEMGVLEAAGDLCAFLQKAKCTRVKQPQKPKVRQSSGIDHLHCMCWAAEQLNVVQCRQVKLATAAQQHHPNCLQQHYL